MPRRNAKATYWRSPYGADMQAPGRHARSCGHERGQEAPFKFAILFAGFVAIALPLRAQVIEYSPTLSSVAAPLPADDTATGNGLITGQFGAKTAPFDYAIRLSIRGAHYDNIALTRIHRLDDWFVQIQPSLMLEIGGVAKQETFLMLNYLPSVYRYDNHPECRILQYHRLADATSNVAGRLFLRATFRRYSFNPLLVVRRLLSAPAKFRLDIDGRLL